MDRLRKSSLILFVLVSIMLFSAVASADVQPVSFTLEATAITDKILEDGSAEFMLKINNMQDVEDTFRILPLEDVKWTPQVIPVLDRSKTIAADSSASIRLFVKPNEVPRGSYNLKLTVESQNTKTRYNTVLRVHVGPHPSMYEPDISTSVSIPPRLDPNQDYDVKITLRNNNIIDLGNVHVSAKSNLANSEQDITLGPEGEKIVSVAIHMPDDIQPQTDTLNVKVLYGDTVFYDKDHQFEVMEYLPPFAQNMTVKKSFLKTVKKVVLRNDGNTQKTSPVKLETARRLDLFTKTYPKADLVEEGDKLFYVWSLSLAPEQVTTITITTSYRWFAALILLAIILYIIYWVMKAPIVVSKKHKEVTYEEGSISEAKVVLHIKNRTGKPIKHVHIVERLPHVVGVKKGAFKHTLEPTKAYKHGKEGTVLEYQIPVLEPKEERLISYTLKSKLQIIGGLKIKPTLVKYTGKAGHTEKAFSSELDIPGSE